MRTLCFLYCLSGFVSLGYQVAWFRILSDLFGATNLTFGLVVSSFIGGLAAGSLSSRRLTPWLTATLKRHRGLKLYGLVEIVVSLTALLTLLLPLITAHGGGSFPYQLRGSLLQLSWSHGMLQGAGALLCVFVPCFFMGITFPLLCDIFRGHPRFPARLYGWNTLGACLAVLVCEFLLLPSVGHTSTFVLMVALNALVGIYFLCVAGDGAANSAFKESAVATTTTVTSEAIPISLALLCAILSGGITGALEADLFKRLYILGFTSAVAMSFISFWAIVAIFLASWSVHAYRTLTLRWIQIAAVFSLACYALLLQVVFPLHHWTHSLFQFSSNNYVNGLMSLLVFTGILVFPAFFLLSLLLPYICNAVQRSRRHLGLVYGINTAAFCLGMISFTWLAPRVNVFYSLRLFLVFYVIAVALLVLQRPGRPMSGWKTGLALAGCVSAVWAIPTGFDASLFRPDSPAASYPVRAIKSNAAHTTFIVGHPAGDILYFDGHQMSGSSMASQRYMRLMAHFPLLAHPHPKAALLICFGVGNTASAIACHPTIEQIDLVDLNDKVFETAPEFADVNQNVLQDHRVRAIHDDGRHYLLRTNRKYDLITSEPPPPMNQGVYRLYSEQYYREVLNHLTPHGMMTQWLPTHQLPEAAMRRIVSTFVNVFPHTLLLVGQNENFILWGGKSKFELANIEKRFADSHRVTEDLRTIGIKDPVSLLARIMKTKETLSDEFASYPVISDQRNDLSRFAHAYFEPPLITYDPVAVWRELSAQPLASADALQRTLLHLGRLKSKVPDFPVASLMSASTKHAAQVALADVDWIEVDRRLSAARTAIQQQRLEVAIDHMRSALSISGELPFVVSDLAQLLTLTGQDDAALTMWQNYQQLEPEQAAGFRGAGRALMRLSRLSEATTQLKQAVGKDDHSWLEYQLLGDTHSAVGQLGDALAAYEQALALKPSDEDLRRKREATVARLGDEQSPE